MNLDLRTFAPRVCLRVDLGVFNIPDSESEDIIVGGGGGGAFASFFFWAVVLAGAFLLDFWFFGAVGVGFFKVTSWSLSSDSLFDSLTDSLEVSRALPFFFVGVFFWAAA